MMAVAVRPLRHPRRAGEGHEHGAEGIEGGQPGRDQRHPEQDLPGFRSIQGVEADGGACPMGSGCGREAGEAECSVGRSDRVVRIMCAGPGLRMEGGQDLVLAEEAGEGRHAGQGRRPHEEGGRRDRHHAAQASESPHVDHAAHGVHHRACAKKQERLEAGVGEQVEDRRGEAEQRAGAEAREHVAKLADRRIGEHPFEVVLHRADERRDQRRRGAHDRHDRQRAGAGGKERGRPRDQVDAGGHHRGGMDQGAGGGGALHGIWQPDVQRQLGALATGRQQEEQTDRGADQTTRVPRRIGQPGLPEDTRHDHAIGGDGVVEVERAVGHPEQEDRDRQSEVADAVDEECLLGRAGRLRFREPEADQQVAAGADRLPEDVDEQKVAGGHEHRHREYEHRHQREEPGIARIAVHVAGRINGHEQADAGDDREHRGGERIEPQRHGDREAADVLPRCKVLRCQTRIGGRAAGRGRVGRVERGPLPERRDHFHGPDRLRMGAVGGAHVTGSRRQQRDGHDGGSGDAGHRRQVGAMAEGAAQKHGEDRACQRQQRHEHQQRCGGKFLHGDGGCGWMTCGKRNRKAAEDALVQTCSRWSGSFSSAGGRRPAGVSVGNRGGTVSIAGSS